MLYVNRPIIMGILNVTPDSFSDGGEYVKVAAALAHAQQMLAEGADIIDIGGESARPGAQPTVSVEEELRRVLPVIKALRQETNLAISIDTYKPEVMQAAVDAGASLINDIYALRKPGALAAAAACEVPICLMHMQGEPHNMQDAPQYLNILDEITAFFKERITACEAAGINRQRLILDPGFGFGKTAQHNMFLTKHLAELKDFGLPLLFGASRKATIGAILDKPASERLYGSIAAAVLAVANGANIIRVHDVAATKDALTIAQEILSA
jgi:dihydropteroate synthase